MAIAIRLEQTGGTEVLRLQPTKDLPPGPGEVWIEQEAIGVNYLDVSQRRGDVPISLPSGLGLEAAGRVSAVDSSVRDVTVGERFAYILGPIGSYASGRIYPANRLVRLPEGITTEQAATVLFKGITAHYLLHSTYTVAQGTVILLYGAAGALGQIMVPWAKSLGAFVIGVVSKEASATRARGLGCDAVLVWGLCDLPGEVAKLTGGHKADVVYDGIGKTTFATSLDCLRPRGLMVSLGASSGAPEPVELNTLNAKGALYLTRPGLGWFATDIAEYQERADAVFRAVAAKIINPEPSHVFPLSQAAEAHSALEQGRAGGAIVLRP